jgi:homoserine kinase
MPRRVQSVTVKVPASTSNLGSGFDTLGLALNLYNYVSVKRVAHGDTVLDSAASDIDNKAAALDMVRLGAQAFFEESGIAPFGIAVSLRGDVPVARGVGFSATIRVGLVASLNALTKAGLDEQQLLDIGSALEGHPDNVSPALLGGFTASGKIEERTRCLRWPVRRRLKIVALFPQLQLRTDLARAVLPPSYSKEDTARILNRSALITAAFAQENYEALQGLFDDRMHQPYREKLLPKLTDVIRAGEEAGALGGFLSGAGSGIICLTLHNEDRVARAMQKILPDSETRILGPDNQGLRLQ